jgi:hypothetical protein
MRASSDPGCACTAARERRAIGAVVCSVAIGLLAVSSSAAAQRTRAPARAPLSSGVILRGTILRGDSTPASYAGVEIVEAHQRRFGDADGKFSVRVAPGRYHVRVRQIGFAPRDTVVTVLGDTPQLIVRMVPVPLVLSEVTVKARTHCEIGGIDTTNDVLRDMFNAVRENAVRELLLRRSYPFEYLVEVALTDTPASGRRPRKPNLDTLIYRSDAILPYARGGIVFTDRTDPRGAWDRMRVPAMIDFADDNFVKSHCFDYGNTDSGDYSISFMPLDAITVPDVSGTITFDTATYVVRTADVKLTHANQIAPGFERLEVHTTYQEFLPRVALPVVIRTTQFYNTAAPDPMLFVANETQTIRSLRFLDRVPDGVGRTENFAVTGGPKRASLTGDETSLPLPPIR